MNVIIKIVIENLPIRDKRIKIIEKKRKICNGNKKFVIISYHTAGLIDTNGSKKNEKRFVE